MNSNRDIDHRIHLVRENEQLIALSVSKAKVGIADIAVLVLDTRDPVARDLARAIVERSTDLDLDTEEARILRKPDVVPTGLAVIPLAAARAGFGVSHPKIAEGLRAAPPTGRVRVVVVAAGGATLLHLPVTRMGATGSA
jgi:hypothetical protein